MAGGRVDLTRGVFNTAAAITMKGLTTSAIMLCSQGLRATTIKRTSGQSFDIIDIGNGTDWIYDIELRDLQVHGYDAAASAAGVGICIQKADNVRLSSVQSNFVQDAIHVKTGTQYMQWDWVICENFNQYGIYFDQGAGNPGHYLLNGVQCSIPDAVTGVKAVYFANRTDASFYPITFNDLSIWCPATSVTNSVGVNVAGTDASSVVDCLTFNAGMIEGVYNGLLVGANSSRNIVLNGTTFPGNNSMYRGIVGTTAGLGDVFLNNCYFMDVTAGAGVAVDSTNLNRVVIDNCYYYNCDTNVAGNRIQDRNIYDNKHGNATTDDTLTFAENGGVFTNRGAIATMTYTLPADPPRNTHYTFAVMAARQLRVAVGKAGDKIYACGAITTDDGGADLYIVADDEGETLSLMADENGDWFATSMYGTWTVTQP